MKRSFLRKILWPRWPYIKVYIFLNSLEDISSVYHPDSVVEKGVDEQHFVVHFCCTSVKGI